MDKDGWFHIGGCCKFQRTNPFGIVRCIDTTTRFFETFEIVRIVRVLEFYYRIGQVFNFEACLFVFCIFLYYFFVFTQSSFLFGVRSNKKKNNEAYKKSGNPGVEQEETKT